MNDKRSAPPSDAQAAAMLSQSNQQCKDSNSVGIGQVSEPKSLSFLDDLESLATGKTTATATTATTQIEAVNATTPPDTPTPGAQTTTTTNAQERYSLRAIPLEIFNIFDSIGDIIKEYSSALAVHSDMVIAPTLAVGATAAGQRLELTYGAYSNPALLWLCLVARVSQGKTEPAARMLAPLEEIDDKEFERHLAALDEWESNGNKGKKPTYKQIILSDITQEAQAEAVFGNQDRVIWYRDEIAALIRDFGKYKSGKDSGESSDLLSIWSQRPINVRRKGNTPIKVKRPFVGMYGTTQQRVLPRVFGRSSFLDDGFTARWLFVMPEIGLSVRRKTRAINPELEELWRKIIHGIIDYCNENPGATKLSLSEKAAARYEKFCDELTDKKREYEIKLISNYGDDFSSYMLAAVSKFDIHILRLAVALQALRIGERAALNKSQEGSQVIELDIMEAAIKLCEYFMNTADAVYRLILDSKQPGNTASIGNEQLLALMVDRFNIDSSATFANTIGISRQAVEKAWNKHNKYQLYQEKKKRRAARNQDSNANSPEGDSN